jgi:hypothetical protein
MDTSSTPSQSSGHSPFVPVLLVELALIVVLAWQFANASRQRSALRQIEQSRAGMVEQSRAVQGDLQRLASGLLDLAQTDPDARELVQRYGIGRTQSPPNP